MSFSIPVLSVHHDKLRGVMADMEHITFNEDGQSGTIKQDGATVAFKLAGEDDIDFDVTDNPDNVPESEIKERIAADIKAILSILVKPESESAPA